MKQIINCYRYALIVTLSCLFSGNFTQAATPDYASKSSVKVFGAKGDGVTDDTEAINSAIAWCEANNYKTLYFPNGNYLVSAPLTTLNSSFSVLSLVGESPNQTTITSSASAGTAIFSTSGGSGQLCGAEIRDLAITGSGTQIGIENQGTCGLTFHNCIFDNLQTGILFSNDIAPGTYTEYSVAESCIFTPSCTTPVMFVRGAGDSSFNGSGLKGCKIQNSSSNNTPAIVVGNPGEVINLYNAPMDFQIWTSNPMSIVSIASTESKVITYGTITIEAGGSSPPTIASGATMYHSGSVISWSDILYGTLHLENAVKTLPNGAIVEDRKIYRIQTTLNSATTALPNIQTSPFGTLVSVTIGGNYYDYRYLLYVVASGYGNPGVVTILANPIAYNGSGLGAPTFSVDNNNVFNVTQSSYASNPVGLTATVTTLGSPNMWNIMEY